MCGNTCSTQACAPVLNPVLDLFQCSMQVSGVQPGERPILQHDSAPCASAGEVQPQTAQLPARAAPQPENNALSAPQGEAVAGSAQQPSRSCRDQEAVSTVRTMASLSWATAAQGLATKLAAAAQCIASVAAGTAEESPVGELAHGVLVCTDWAELGPCDVQYSQ